MSPLPLLIAQLLTVSPASSAPLCQPPEGEPNETLSVAWVSPLNKKARSWSRLDLVPTSELRRWSQEQESATVGNLLFTLKRQKKPTEPRRRYKVVIFEVQRGELCYKNTLNTLQHSSAQWSIAARRGFCVLPAERFLHPTR